MGRAVKIIDIDESGEAFVLKEKALKKIFERVPADMPISLVSVVGAFRTGKSFLLDFFLRYLRNTGDKPDLNYEKPPEMGWIEEGGKLEGLNTNKGGFGWKHGTERCTTGIWLWDEYFERVIPGGNGKKCAVFILDTQGMYDSKTGQHLTASIFGLGTLLSSYTVYNLVFQIQENHLQHLALFSEYGRVAVEEAAASTGEDIHPFQKLEFLVRDFRNLELEDDPEDNNLDIIHEQMEEYLQSVLSQKFQKDLKEVRDQIELCYEDVSCYCLPYPGEHVAERKKYDGNVKKIRPIFKFLLSDYCRRVFGEKLAVKTIQGQPVNAMQLFEFVKVYCKLFRESKIFPEAKTLFRATQEANIAGAIARAMSYYKKEMDKRAGPGKQYMKEEKLFKYHKKAVDQALEEFYAATKIGSKEVNKQAEKKLKIEIQDRYKDYQESNRLRDPMAFIAPYIIPIIIAFGAYIARYVLETVCPRRNFTCLDFADFFGSLYIVILTFLGVHIFSTVYGVKQHLGGMFSVASKIKAD
mmetsp:Transcript_7221/g.9417  ORF Transcript_7221/g.9417 Transcript_7221/m.9417 type:complete len:524 (+) Transcript_7221:263-1834(+)|eukprot:CAMPEP_0204861776 /NCGR_PEP_ID=MMETSP1348-20121228/1885_1 /ASSEMBLY_ACC=CAM_ASM_000700 /TAXON_ID=215587 /ORGANISM="Aplanochytrium stocchinoi, Strain GSBS06" /LENGTH=523 /DNA_ID=CAMNT_0052011343 /DNA_START=252 /DNA_END=1823 /DNA_ORIENTATION=+